MITNLRMDLFEALVSSVRTEMCCVLSSAFQPADCCAVLGGARTLRRCGHTVRLLTSTMEPGPHTSPSPVIITIMSHYVSMLVMMTGVATSQTVTLPSAVRKQLPDTDTAAARPRRDIDPHNLLSWSWSH